MITLMWELANIRFARRDSVRRFFTLVVASFLAIISATLLNLSVPQDTYADAQRTGSSLIHEGNTYVRADQTTASNLDLSGNEVYTYVEPVTEEDRRIHVIYYSNEGSETGTYVNYAYNGPGNYSDASGSQNIDIANDGSDEYTSCAVEGGLGWAICPITNLLAGFMDSAYSILAGFLEVRPLQTDDTDNAIYRAWSYMRSFANVAFVIAFIIIIYSQLTSIGLSNYSLKRLVPRLIIAAILVNVSYIICALFVDLSNFLGYSIQALFESIRNNLIGSEMSDRDLSNWQNVTAFILSAGTLATVAGIGGISAIGAYGILGALALLIPALIGGLLAVLVALLLIAGRQALITTLIVLAPLAFVAYLLPNTERWFERWRSIFMTMLILFPAFSVIFGGSQLAAAVILDRADNINVVVLALLVQAAPLFITPLLIKFSGQLLSRVAGFANNPNRAISGRAKGYVGDRVNERASRLNAIETPKTGTKGFMRRRMQAYSNTKRRRENTKTAHDAMSEAKWKNTSDYAGIKEMQHTANETSAYGESQADQQIARNKIINPEMRELDIKVRKAKLDLENAETEANIENWDKLKDVSITDSRITGRMLKDTSTNLQSRQDIEYEELKAGQRADHMPYNARFDSLQNRAQDNSRLLALNAMRNEAAKQVISQKQAEELRLNETEIDGKQIQEYAGGVQGQVGAQRALATALSAESKAQNESIANAHAILTHGNYKWDDVGKLANNESIDQLTVTEDLRLAAVDKISKSGNTDAILSLAKNLSIDGSDESQDMRQIFSDNMIANKGRPAFMSAGVIDNIRQGNTEVIKDAGEGRVDKFIIDAFNSGAYGSAQTLVSEDKSYLWELERVMKNDELKSQLDTEKLETFKGQYAIAREDSRYSGQIGKREDVLNSIGNHIDYRPSGPSSPPSSGPPSSGPSGPSPSGGTGPSSGEPPSAPASPPPSR